MSMSERGRQRKGGEREERERIREGGREEERKGGTERGRKGEREREEAKLGREDGQTGTARARMPCPLKWSDAWI